MKTKVIAITLVVVMIVFPFTTLAAWWNPFSWFQIQNIAQQSGSTELNSTLETPESGMANDSVASTTEIAVADPVVQARIDALIAENASLRQQIRSLQTQLNIEVEPPEISKEVTTGTYQMDVRPLIERLEMKEREREKVEVALDEKLEEFRNELEQLTKDDEEGQCSARGRVAKADGTVLLPCSELPGKISDLNKEILKLETESDEAKLIADLKEEEAEIMQDIERLKLRYGID